MIEVLGIPMYTKGIDVAIAEFEQLCLEDSSPGKCISASGAHGLVCASEDAEFRRTLEQFYWNLPDGMPTVWIGKMKGASGMNRCYGPDFFAGVMQQTSKESITHFLCGGQEGVADLLKANCAERFCNQNIVGTNCPPFRELLESEILELAAEINESGADVIWIGLSTPRQEKFALRLSGHVSSRFLVTVGAAFDFHTDRVRQAPKIFQKIGMEWFFRLCVEPVRLFPRYLEIVPKFIYFNVLELINKGGVQRS